jgi:hypothetical protein
MTFVMQELFRRLSAAERYPLPPREITERAATAVRHDNAASLPDASLNAHLAYGAAAGALLVLARRRPGILIGAVYGVLVWAGSYFGWAPALRILKPANEQPVRRSLLMIAAHLVWGGVTAVSLGVFAQAKAGMLADGRLADAGAGPDRLVVVRERGRTGPHAKTLPAWNPERATLLEAPEAYAAGGRSSDGAGVMLEKVPGAEGHTAQSRGRRGRPGRTASYERS